MDWSSFLHPQRVAVVGASRDPAKVGYRLVANAIHASNVEVIPINPQAAQILDRRAYPTLRQVPGHINVVVLAIPLQAIEKVIDDCVDVRPELVVVITAGFAEMGEQGLALQQKIADRLQKAGIALLGPNTMGYTYTPSQLNISFGPPDVPTGNVAILSQSGALLSAAFEAFRSAECGVSLAVSLGNKAGIAEQDLLECLAGDAATQVVLLYLESVVSPQKFFAATSKLAQSKPVFLLQGGTTTEGVKASVSHTAALATSSALLAGAQHQGGFVLVENLEELLRAGIAASHWAQLPENVAVVTNAGGPSVVLVDELSRRKVPMARLSSQTITAIEDKLPGVRPANPLDLRGDASPQSFRTATELLYADPQVDSIAVVVTEQAVTNIAQIVQELTTPPRKKGLFVSFSAGDELGKYRQQLRHKGIFTTEYPNQVATTLSSLVRAAHMRRSAHLFSPLQLTTSPRFAYPQNFEMYCQLLQQEGLQLPRQVLVRQVAELSALSTLQYPLIAKTTSLDLKHKANVGAVVPRINTPEEALRAFQQLQHWTAPVVYQEYVQGLEMLVGVVQDPIFGWYMAFGLGGSYTNVLADRAYVFLSATREDFHSALLETRLGKALAESQQSMVLDFLQKVAEFAGTVEHVTELEFNPVFISKDKCVIADMKRAAKSS